ncbi:uracil-DNA glycosylase [Pararhodobacter oceanensis]|uniref:Type-4 uracil-DNA glycosylase n=1 Tax=Pararhodobacter oceanensis TaxID=2172121 RepID=A0A2T8HYF2_9RHOB|nr:uracil-DNA glycosylase [Pararhodobacter oceanensis]PVH30475.1 uracil-DNA glycosylase [Pararhodobacter oceanensis]
MTMVVDWHLARALLEWQVELGVTDTVLAEPVDRFARVEPPAAAAAVPQPGQVAAPPPMPQPQEIDTVAEARAAAAAAQDLPALKLALQGFAHCELRRGARNCVFADGNPQAHVMVIGEGPGAEEDRKGRPFVGASGQLLDQMFAAIGLSRRSEDPASALYITNTVPWRPPANREPSKHELAMLRPFLLRHIELVKPRLLVLVGNTACEALLNARGITKLRGTWAEAQALPAMPITHPAFLLRFPEAKREAWADLLEIKARLKSLG